MIRIAIVDDEEQCRNDINRCVIDYMKLSDEQYKISMFADAIDLMTRYDFSYDIIFMDIDMKLSDGMKMAHKLRTIDQNVCLIFATKLAKYAIEGYSVDALGYILKPVNYYNVAIVLKKAISVITKARTKATVIVSSEGQKKVIDSDDIRYIEVIDHSLVFHTVDGDFTDWGTLGEKEKLLQGHNFIRVHRCYLVNLKHISNVTSNSVILFGGDVCPLSRNMKKDVLQALSEYYNIKN